MEQKNSQVIIGIDPGSLGAICILENNRPQFYKLPYFDGCLDVYELSNILASARPHRIIIEKPFIMPGNRNKGLTSQLTNYGALWATCKLSIHGELVEVMPRVWKKALQLGNDKDDSIKKAKEINPNIDLKLTKRSKVDNHNAAEAFLLAHWGSITI